jgi:hypothetical protein
VTNLEPRPHDQPTDESVRARSAKSPWLLVQAARSSALYREATSRIQRVVLLLDIYLLVALPWLLLAHGVLVAFLAARLLIVLAAGVLLFSRLHWVRPWPPDAVRLRGAVLAGLAAEWIAGPLLVGLGISQAWAALFVGLPVATRVCLDSSISGKRLAVFVAASVLAIAGWLGPLGANSSLWLERIPDRLNDPAQAAGVGLAFALLMTTAQAFERPAWDANPEDELLSAVPPGAPEWNVVILLAGFIFVATCCLLSYTGFPDSPWWGPIASAAGLAGGYVVGTSLGGHITARMLRSAARGTLHRLVAIYSLGEYLRDRTKLLGAFILGYLVVAMWFAGAYRMAAGRNPAAFTGLFADGSLVDFAYFSFVTMATVGYGDIVPRSQLARILVLLEIASGWIWTTVVFAGIVWQVQRGEDATGKVGDSE